MSTEELETTALTENKSSEAQDTIENIPADGKELSSDIQGENEQSLDETVFVAESQSDAYDDNLSENAELIPTDDSSEESAEPLSLDTASDEQMLIESESKQEIASYENEDNGISLEGEEKIIQKSPKERGIDMLFDVLELFIFSLVTVLLVTTFLFRHSIVDGSSMENTLHGGEHLIISDLFYTPERGDIIVCEDYETSLRKPIVKRVIGLPGDHIVVTSDYTVYVNGDLLQEDYVYVDFYNPTPAVDIVVPQGEVFVLGDHRNNSTDSRYFGTIKIDSILGRVLFRFYPLDKFGAVE